MNPEELKAAMEKLLLPRSKTVSYLDGSGEFVLHIDGWRNDPEEGHCDADKLMVATLRALGYGEAMDIYEAQKRVYG